MDASMILSIVSTAILIAGFFWGLRYSIKELMEALERSDKRSSEEHTRLLSHIEALEVRMDESIRQDAQQHEKMIDSINEMEKRNSDQHTKFTEALAEIKAK